MIRLQDLNCRNDEFALLHDSPFHRADSDARECDATARNHSSSNCIICVSSPPAHFELNQAGTMSAVGWPPAQSAEQEAALLSLASDWSLSHGLVLRPVGSAASPPSTTASIHAPYSLYPSPFPRKLFDQAKELQEIYNSLYASVTVDKDFLEDVIGGGVALVDEFQGRLYEIWRTVEAEGVKQVRILL